MSADTVVPDQVNSQDWNRYSYVRNNPIKLVDPTGHRAECYGTDAFISESDGDGGISWASCWARQRDKRALIEIGAPPDMAEAIATSADTRIRIPIGDEYHLFIPTSQRYLAYSDWQLVMDPIPVGEFSISLADLLPFDLPFDILPITIAKGMGEFELWERYIAELQDGESWLVQNYLVVDQTGIRLEYEKIELVDANTTVVLAGWYQDLLVFTTYDQDPIHYNMGWDVGPQPGPWDYSRDLDTHLQTNGVWPYPNMSIP